MKAIVKAINRAVCGPCLALVLLGGCSGAEESESESPYQTRAAFCAEWGKAACSSRTVDACQAGSPEDCQESQRQRCLDLVPTPYAPDTAPACLSAVKSAFADADLTHDELSVVVDLGAPCDRLVRGPGSLGMACSSGSDCDGPAGLSCVVKGELGTCQAPELVNGGFECALPQQICENGFFCNGQNCVAYKRLGAECSSTSECGSEGYCRLNPDSDLNECAARADVNQACELDEECRSGMCFALSSGESTCVEKVRLSPSEPMCQYLR